MGIFGYTIVKESVLEAKDDEIERLKLQVRRTNFHWQQTNAQQEQKIDELQKSVEKAEGERDKALERIIALQEKMMIEMQEKMKTAQQMDKILADCRATVKYLIDSHEAKVATLMKMQRDELPDLIETIIKQREDRGDDGVLVPHE